MESLLASFAFGLQFSLVRHRWMIHHPAHGVVASKWCTSRRVVDIYRKWSECDPNRPLGGIADWRRSNGSSLLTTAAVAFWAPHRPVPTDREGNGCPKRTSDTTLLH